MVIVPLVLSAFIHLWNPIGFPGIHPDEGHYMRRALEVLLGQGPQETELDFNHPYDHPYFGQIFLAALFKVIGYPDSLHLQPGALSSIQTLYSIPRIIMGLLAIIDTFILFQIAKKQYNQNVAFFASMLFAIMPITWIFRRVYLDNLLMPFLLSSVLFSLYIIDRRLKSEDKSAIRLSSNLYVLMSGIFLGTAIYTKIPSITLIPLVGFLVLKHSNRNMKVLAIWLMPVVLIPLLWPAYSFSIGHIDDWLNGLYRQQNRVYRAGLSDSLVSFFVIDPILTISSLIGLIFAALRKDMFLLLWIIPFLLFSYYIGWVQYFHLALIIPALCIAVAVMVNDIGNKFTMPRVITKFSGVIILIPILIFGFASSVLLISVNINDLHMEAYALVTKHIFGDGASTVNGHNYSSILLIGHWIYFWIPKFVFHANIDTAIRLNDFPTKTEDIKDLESKKIILIEDDNRGTLMSYNRPSNVLYNRTIFPDVERQYDVNKYPYTSLGSDLNFNLGYRVLIATNFESNETKFSR